MQLKLYLLVLHVAQATLYDYRGLDGTGTASNPVSDKNSSNYVEYTVRKLADGNCWMAEDLKLTLTNNQAIRVGTFSGGETSWTPTGDGAGNDYNEAINANTKSNISVNGKNEWYYPWYAATAGQGTQTSNPTISQSICPKGWKLPNHASLQNLIINKYLRLLGQKNYNRYHYRLIALVFTRAALCLVRKTDTIGRLLLMAP